MYKKLLILLTVFLAVSCFGKADKVSSLNIDPVTNGISDTVTCSFNKSKLSRSAQILDSLGYVNVADVVPSIAINIVYATANNFTGEVLYDDLTEAYVLPEVGEKLKIAQKLLKDKHPDYSLIIYDAARPFSAQKRMWKVAVKTNNQYYVANPAKGGGLHNYGAAVDISILDENGSPLPMGTEFDFFGKEANTDQEKMLVKLGLITAQELENRLLLRTIMKDSGFSSIKSEWWHFNHCSREEAKKRYPLIDF